MPVLSEAAAQINRDKRTAIERAKRQLRGVKGRDGDERQMNIEINGRDWWVHFRLENRNWRVVTVERWKSAF